MDPDFDVVRDYLTGLQDRICAAIEAADGRARFAEDAWTRQPEGGTGHAGGGRTRILRDGAVFEQAGIGFSDVSGTRLPPSASAARPELAGASWRATGVSLVFHPEIPTCRPPTPTSATSAPSATARRWPGGSAAVST